MIKEFKLFEYLYYAPDYGGVDKTYKFKLGQDVYYHGKGKDYHGYYIVKDVYFDNEQNIWRYDLSDLRMNRLKGVWEMSLSPTEEEGKRKNADFERNQEEEKYRHMDIYPLGEEDW